MTVLKMHMGVGHEGVVVIGLGVVEWVIWCQGHEGGSSSGNDGEFVVVEGDMNGVLVTDLMVNMMMVGDKSVMGVTVVMVVLVCVGLWGGGVR